MLKAEDFEWRMPALTARVTHVHRLGLPGADSGEPLPVNSLGTPHKLFADRLLTGKYLMSEEGLLKRCGRCREYKPATRQFFYGHFEDQDSLTKRCKACMQPARHGLTREKPAQP